VLTPTDFHLIDKLHGGFPLIDRPFEQVGHSVGMSEEGIIERLKFLLSQGILTRFGPLFQIERAGGLFVLAALKVPDDRFETVAALVNRHPEVAHNYRREHQLNMWFVVATESPVHAQKILDLIQVETECQVFSFPKEKEFFVELRLPVEQLPGEGYATID
jgi:DNA-binding Lrp family transcriptional regulator